MDFRMGKKLAKMINITSISTEILKKTLSTECYIFTRDRQIWFEQGHRWETGTLRAIYHALDDCKFIIEDRVGTLHAKDMDKIELFAPNGDQNIILRREQNSDLEINTPFSEALLLFLIIPPGEYHLCKYFQPFFGDKSFFHFPTKRFLWECEKLNFLP